MAKPQPVDDFSSDELLDDGGVSGQLVPSNGYMRAVFTPTTREALENIFKKLIDIVLKDYGQIDERRSQNLQAHEGLSSKGEAITIPIAKRDSNQQLAWLLMTLFSKKPMISVRPLESGRVQIISADEFGNPKLDFVTSEEEAQDLEDLLDFYLRDKIGFKKLIRTWVAELLRDGNRPPILKVLHDPRELPQMGSVNVQENPASTKPGERISLILDDPVFSEVKDGHPTRIECIPGDKFFIPLPEYDIQSAPFVFQEFEEDSLTIKKKIASGKYNLCLPEGETPDPDTIDLILSGAQNLETMKRQRVDGRVASDPMKKHRLFELWFYFPFGEEDESGAPVYRLHSFCSVFHWESKKFLTCYDNIYWHAKRPFHAGYIQQRPFSFSGYSTTENVAPFQRLISQLFHLQLQNMVQQNVKVFLVRKTSSTYRFLSGGKKLRPGLVIPFDEPDDVSPHQLGASISSIANEISFLNTESEKMSVVNQYDRGAVPQRTAAAAIQTVQELAKMQPAMNLDSIRETLGDVVKMFVQTLIQFSPTGITIPFKRESKRAAIERIIRFPRKMITEEFAFEVTATAEDDTPEAEFNKDVTLNQQLDGFNNALMQISSAAWQPTMPPPLQMIGTKMILGKRRMVARLLSHARVNPDDYLPTEEEIEQVPQALMGGISGLPVAGPGGVVPGGGGFGQGPQLMEAQSNDQGGVGANLPGAIPSDQFRSQG